MQFTGAPNQRIELLANGPDGIRINTLKAVTVEAWFTAGKSIVPWQRIFDFGASTELGARFDRFAVFLLHAHRAHQSAIGCIQAVSGEATADGPVVTTPKETHIAVVVDDKSMTYYLNGARVSQVELTGRSLAQISPDHALVGQALFGNDATLQGSINELRIYAAPLKPAQAV